VLFRLTGAPDLYAEAYVPNGDESTCVIQQGSTKCEFAVADTHRGRHPLPPRLRC
jgi:hypothetical protein